jgi:hypothetical protein
MAGVLDDAETGRVLAITAPPGREREPPGPAPPASLAPARMPGGVFADAGQYRA